MLEAMRDGYGTGRVAACARLAACAVVAVTGCAQRPPPIERYDVKFEMPKPPAPRPEPPASALRPWRVWVNQEQPRQKKNPEWRSFGAKDGVLLDMAPDGKWRCLINPVSVLGTAGEKAKLTGWLVSRTIRCSSDGWKTSTESRVRAGFDVEGKPSRVDASSVVYLRDTVAGQERVTVVVLEGERVAGAE